MEKRTKKLKVLLGERSQNIGDLLQPVPRPNMVAQRDSRSSVSSAEDTLDAPDNIPDTGDLNTSLSTEDLNTTATKGDILDLMKNMRAFFNADLAVVREEISAMMARIQVAEEDASSIAQRQVCAAEQTTLLQATSHTASPNGKLNQYRLKAVIACPPRLKRWQEHPGMY
ncbi:Hypothetical predicted protein [Pelobates cultripes]|uniref:Uncharacterized protein n=1 Tax=Pelobates cultripes TaxID=61616 RepID=A0AAD1WRM4_PELCU|nr:Hypothetical predicted protein [Pelobates cultripes]